MFKAAVACLGLAAAMSLGGVADAATVSNDDTEDRIVTVTENGQRREFTIPPGEAVSLCSEGCFISFPSGNLLALKGEEKVRIENGEGRLVAP